MEIGDKVLGFKPKDTDLNYVKEFVGRVGYVDAIQGVNVRINYGEGDSWWYFEKEAAKHIVEKDYDPNSLPVRVKKLHPNSVTPFYSTKGDAGLDLTAVSKSVDEFGNTVFDTGLAFEIPEGFVGLLFPRSSNAKTDLRLTNSVGVLDSGFRGSVLFKYRNDNYVNVKGEDVQLFSEGVLGFGGDYEVGDRVGQLIIMPYPKVKLIEVDELSETERGEGGYGSSGK